MGLADPFVCGIVVGAVGVWLRRGIEEPPAFVDAEDGRLALPLPIREVLAYYRGPILQTFGITQIWRSAST